MNLFVTGLSNDIDDIDLKEMFELYGEVTTARVVLDKETKRSRGFGFVEMPDVTEAKEAINTLNGAGLRGKRLGVQEAEERKPNNNSGGFQRRDNNNRRGGGGGGYQGGGGGGYNNRRY
ncbi:RNA recognition motif domain-containing protein [Deminuibacter soli]|uniref:RNA-binding protein n=1 Tax=Deminuibacter soli TaxID=2291815 RepID=A0A3E1NII3_9BACT|nr:RNA-binding protein [Deminuibacter soli]RFM27634.1 RNA-binding protein [Deminuibacter soli]